MCWLQVDERQKHKFQSNRGDVERSQIRLLSLCPRGNATGASAGNIDYTATSCCCLCNMTVILIGTEHHPMVICNAVAINYVSAFTFSYLQPHKSDSGQ